METDTFSIASSSSSADSFTLHQEGENLTGTFLTTSLTGEQQGTETFTLYSQTITNGQTNWTNGSYEFDNQNNTQYKGGQDSFTLNKIGSGSGTAFVINSMTLVRSGNESYNKNSQAGQTWHMISDGTTIMALPTPAPVTYNYHSTEDGWSFLSVSASGVDSSNATQAMFSTDGLNVTTTLTSSEAGSEYYSQSADANKVGVPSTPRRTSPAIPIVSPISPIPRSAITPRISAGLRARTASP